MCGASVKFGFSDTRTVISNTGVIMQTYIIKAILNAGMVQFTVSTVVTSLPREDHNRLALTVKVWEHFRDSGGRSEVDRKRTGWQNNPCSTKIN